MQRVGHYLRRVGQSKQLFVILPFDPAEKGRGVEVTSRVRLRLFSVQKHFSIISADCELFAFQPRPSIRGGKKEVMEKENARPSLPSRTHSSLSGQGNNGRRKRCELKAPAGGFFVQLRRDLRAHPGATPLLGAIGFANGISSRTLDTIGCWRFGRDIVSRQMT